MEQQNVFLGVDTIELSLETPIEIAENNVVFKNKNGIEIGKLTHKQGKVHGYRLNINLPKCVRSNNIQPFGILDACRLFETTEIITRQLAEQFGECLPGLFVKTAEVNATAILNNKNIVRPMLNLIAGMFLQDRESVVYLAARGKKNGRRYKNIETLMSGMDVESIKLPRSSSGRFSQKIYDKGLEKGIADKQGILRVEHVYNRAGLDFAKTGRSLNDFLTVESIKRLIECYKYDFKNYFVQRFWNNTRSVPYYKQCINLIYNDLENNRPLTAALLNKVIVEYDFSFFIKACKMFYKNSESARKAIYRVRKSRELEINEGVVDSFVMFCKSVIT